jgi:hypothetical protein
LSEKKARYCLHSDYLKFYIDCTLQHSITGDQDWQQKEYSISSGIHTLKWVYDDNGGSSGKNCGWVDYVQWSGPSPQQDPSEWQKIEYKYDVAGRRSEKKACGEIVESIEWAFPWGRLTVQHPLLI